MQETTNALSRPTSAPRHHARRVNGFTAIELMVVVGILAILTALAAPSFVPVIERWRVRQASESLQSTLFMARSEAIKRGGNVGIQKKPQGTAGCTYAATEADWDCGWYVFVDTDKNGSMDADTTKEPRLQDVPPSKDVQISVTPSGQSIRFDRYGMMQDSSGSNATVVYSFLVYPSSVGVGSQNAIAVCFTPGGRLKTVKYHSGPPQCS
ncbi:prepilin-type N-terminal cleavage/methylation domain-containing protein [Diaphorobacter sp. HDW4A]|uniref:GspH/FimT family pseudopilin n=1 Tax=Diaphorobacter sp. HDW4A TaxID=2714924 RepID=UPI00140D9B01|nr:GspH/FimT family pseudopilin [Diaphorobacter sp. HDW4A]QIL78771.1 prepilin-type N-terminal cleavage/methylation domain-containing protein [Diaphorobacter sp. HDW4A]